MEYQVGEPNNEKVELVKERVRTGLKLKEQFPNSDSKARDKVIQNVAERVVEIAEILDLNIDKLNYEMKDIPAEGTTAEPTGQLQGEGPKDVPLSEHQYTLILNKKAYELDFEPSGKIPLFKEMSESVRSIDIAHELYHLKQMQKLPKSGQKTFDATKALSEGNPQKYLEDKGELAARMFSLAYVQKRGKSNLIQFATDLATAFGQKKQLEEFKQAGQKIKTSIASFKYEFPSDLPS